MFMAGNDDAAASNVAYGIGSRIGMAYVMAISIIARHQRDIALSWHKGVVALSQ